MVADSNARQPELIDLRRRDRPTLASFTSAPRRAGFSFRAPRHATGQPNITAIARVGREEGSGAYSLTRKSPRRFNGAAILDGYSMSEMLFLGRVLRKCPLNGKPGGRAHVSQIELAGRQVDRAPRVPVLPGLMAGMLCLLAWRRRQRRNA